MKKRALAALLALALTVCLLPGTAKAAGESGIQLGTSGIGTDDEVYFGKYESIPINWNVKSAATDSLAVYSEYVLWGNMYHDIDRVSDNPDLTYNTSKLYTNTLPGFINNTNNFSTIEKALISGLGVSGREGAATDRNGSVRNYWIAKDFITFNWNGTDYWRAYFVDQGGGENDVYLPEDNGVRPAFHLNLTSVLFSSAAENGKRSGTVGAGALNENLTPSGVTSWKLTLRDNTNHGTFGVSTSTVSTTTAGGDVSIGYSGATTGANEYLSAMLVNGSNQVLYYGRLKSIASSTDASGTQAIAIPPLTAGRYTLKIFNEQYNGDYHTDYASELKDVTLTVSAPPGDPSITEPAQAKTVTTTVGSTATFTVTATNATGYQWYIDRGDGYGFVSIDRANAASYTTSAVTMANNGYRYYCRVSNASGGVDSPIFTLNVIEYADIPATGDGATPLLWLGLLLLAGAGLVILRKRRRA